MNEIKLKKKQLSAFMDLFPYYHALFTIIVSTGKPIQKLFQFNKEYKHN